MKVLHEVHDTLRKLRLYCGGSEKARGVGNGVLRAQSGQPRLKVGKFLDLCSGLGGLGIDALPNIIKSYGDNRNVT